MTIRLDHWLITHAEQPGANAVTEAVTANTPAEWLIERRETYPEAVILYADPIGSGQHQRMGGA